METGRPASMSRVTGPMVLAGAIAGAVGGACTLLLEMLYGLFSSTRSFWDAPMATFSWVFGIQHYTRNAPGDHAWPVILGILGFLALTAILGIVFALLMTFYPARGDIATIVAGVAYMIIVWAILRYLIVPLNGGEDTLITSRMVSPQWVWWLSFIVGGLGLGISLDAERRLEPSWWSSQTPLTGGV